ncbi:sensory neuron membrane protein 1-like [Sitodiplosis mosellana]|uniref:sensory neuron membrane protein 1-like n=1 Tax=Sitodiplosis mosellana TaxID=263140 RepID=UPI002444F06D|nr:sensory neuron membrane protein 1-like [Sitodiplosis mosellana]
MFGSQPHFYGADPALRANFASGIEPSKDKHAIFMHFEMLTGTPVYAAKRLQFNLEMVPIEDVPYLTDIREMYYPLFWVEEGAALDEDFVKQIKPVPMVYKIFKILKWTGLVLGFIGIILSGILFTIKQNAAKAAAAAPSPMNIDVKSIEKSLN